MNSEEIAKLAGVSRSTVSRVINHYPNVPEETRAKVEKVIKEYGYIPNQSARCLVGKNCNIIGLFIADMDERKNQSNLAGLNSPYNTKLISEVAKACKKKGYQLLINSIRSKEDLKIIVEDFQNKLITGGIFSGFTTKAFKDLGLLEQSYNVVCIDIFTENEAIMNSIKTVDCNNIQGGYLATQYLLEKGHKEIACITGDDRLSSTERELGYKKALMESGIMPSPDRIAKGFYREDIAYEEALHILQKDDGITAVFAENDIMALGVVKACKELNKRIPEDISIIGYDNIEAVQWLSLDLTTLEADMKQIAEDAVELVLKEEYARKTVVPKLVKRGSIKNI